MNHNSSNRNAPTRPSALQPTGLLCENLASPAKALIRTAKPRFGWIVNATHPGAFQAGMQILVAGDPAALAEDHGDFWDSLEPDIGHAWATSSRSIAVPYDGKPLESNTDYYWKVRVWTSANEVSPWSEVQRFRTGDLAPGHETAGYPLETTAVEPEAVVATAPGEVFVDFGRAAFGTVELTIDAPAACTVELRLGEVSDGPCAIDRAPGGARRYRVIPLELRRGRNTCRVAVPADARNTGRAAILMPEEPGEVLPFRYCELSGLPGPVVRGDVRQIAVHYPFDDGAASFHSSNRILNDVWEMCRYTMKATSFCGIYVDGDRERIPYEADAYINQLGHYCCDREYTLARRTHEYLLRYPTWPTEWAMHSVLIAWADYLYTGDERSIAANYDTLVAKTLVDLEGADGLIAAGDAPPSRELLDRLNMNNDRYIFERRLVDIVDWPQGERDGHVMLPVNTVVNAFHFRSLDLMSRIASALGRDDDARRFGRAAAKTKESLSTKLFDDSAGRYLDGEGTTHSSLHANLFPLAFGAVPADRVASVAAFVQSRGMACSVYASHYLLEALYRGGADDHALALLTSTAERGWAHMVYDVGTTVALEAWDDRWKPNQDWNHAWGAAPANIIPRRLMGVRPLSPGFADLLIAPQPGDLTCAEITVPTVRGSVTAAFERRPGGGFRLEAEIPGNVRAKIGLPLGSRRLDSSAERRSHRMLVDGREVFGTVEGSGLFVDGVGSGVHSFEI